MKDRKDFLTRLKTQFGDCSRNSFLQTLRDFFNDEKTGTAEEYNGIADEQPVVPKQNIAFIDINGTDAWRNHVNRIKKVSAISEGVFRSHMLFKGANISPFVKSVTKKIEEIPLYVDKHFKEPMDINDDTSEDVARETGKFVKYFIWDFLRGCHSGIKHSQGAESKFYESFYDCLENYLASIGVYSKNIAIGMDVRTHAKWFEAPYIKETDDYNKMGKIDEIEVSPYFIPYRDDDGGQDELILKGICIAFGEVKRK